MSLTINLECYLTALFTKTCLLLWYTWCEIEGRFCNGYLKWKYTQQKVNWYLLLKSLGLPNICNRLLVCVYTYKVNICSEPTKGEVSSIMHVQFANSYTVQTSLTQPLIMRNLYCFPVHTNRNVDRKTIKVRYFIRVDNRTN